MLRQITVEHRTPKIATAGVAVLAGPKKTPIPATLLAGIATLTLLASTTACSSDKKPNTPKINQPAPKTAAAPAPVPSSTPQSPAPVAPPISEAEAKTIAQNYYDSSKKAKSSHDIAALDGIETGILLDISKARQARIAKFGNNVQMTEEMANTSEMQAATPQSAPTGSDRWLLSIGLQKLGTDSRSSLGVLRQSQGEGPWKMSFLAFTESKKSLPSVTEISTVKGDGKGEIDYGDNICSDFSTGLSGGSTSSNWGQSAKSTLQSEQGNKEKGITATRGGTVSVQTEPLAQNRTPAWNTTDGGKLVMCSIKVTSNMTAGSAGSFTIDQSPTYENLSGRVTKWRSLTLTNVAMYAFKVPATPNGPIDLVASSTRPLNVDGAPVQ
ncbi:hypothetical protein OG948_27845 [Embleya sp. NBC_00888]|uniref:hypothetical protein n=1 Tax=Embleya sp. NBC_00888 TaxID=2975960 RepID=UPI00386DA612|nr:hypothetical protein OG948_27845 [Embleya sp. NBC_00888]